MTKNFALALAFLALAGAHTATAAPLDDSLAKLPPEEQANQACIVKGIALMRKNKSLARADRVKTSIFSEAIFDGAVVTAPGGAVRSAEHWYKLKFACSVTPDLRNATAFSFELGEEIPEAKWDDLGLW